MVQRHRLRWYGHVLRKDESDWVKKCMYYEVGVVRPRGRTRKTYRKSLSDPANMQGTCYGRYEMEKVRDVV